MTYKTGNLKKFPTFVRMMAGALAGESASVAADILTGADLEELRVKKTGMSTQSYHFIIYHLFPARRTHLTSLSLSLSLHPTPAAPPAVPSETPGKRYLILSYSAEFDLVHYPLPLKHEAVADAQRLKEAVCSLRAELDAVKSKEQR
jgi:coiled-coil domain-containing protein 61